MDTARAVVRASLAMVRTLPPDVTHAQVKAAWAALQLELGWDGRDCRNRLDDSRG